MCEYFSYKVSEIVKVRIINGLEKVVSSRDAENLYEMCVRGKRRVFCWVGCFNS